MDDLFSTFEHEATEAEAKRAASIHRDVLKFLKIESMQPLIDQGRQVWLWPDKDGIDGWQAGADKLGSPNVQVYTKFFDACWIEEDGPKADIADIAVRMLYHPDWVPREIKADEPKAVETEAEPQSQQ